MTKPESTNNPENSIHPQHGKLLEFLNYVYQGVSLHGYKSSDTVLGFIFENNVLAFRASDGYVAQHICNGAEDFVKESGTGVRVTLDNRLYFTVGCWGDY